LVLGTEQAGTDRDPEGFDVGPLGGDHDLREGLTRLPGHCGR
jgi:hypothetical protein